LALFRPGKCRLKAALSDPKGSRKPRRSGAHYSDLFDLGKRFFQKLFNEKLKKINCLACLLPRRFSSEGANYTSLTPPPQALFQRILKSSPTRKNEQLALANQSKTASINHKKTPSIESV
jgi:hypothetical protein